jgi:predicted kinase
VPTLVLVRGLPASGKTTWARALVASRRPGTILRVNRDDLRRSMADPSYSAPVDAVERRISDAEWRLVRGALLDRVDVVVDATNLRASVARRWRALAEACGAGWRVEEVDTDLEECVRRDAARPPLERVGEETLRDLHARFVDPETGRLPRLGLPPRLSSVAGAPYRPVPGTPSAVLVVAEGMVSPESPDVPDAAAVEVVRALAAAGHRVIAVSARAEDERAAVGDWLARHLAVPVEVLLLGAPRKRQRDVTAVLGLFDAHVRDHYSVVGVVEGRPAAARAWREAGLAVIGVAAGAG